MSDAAPLIIIMLLVGGIALWGFLTDWTFSGLLPREGARCTPDEDSKDENAKEYVYDEDKECLVVNRCKEGWEPNYSNTACISASTGESCTVSNPDPNGVYRYDTSGTCALDCNTGYQKSGGVCVSTCDSTTTEYDPIQVGMCLSDDNKSLVTCPYKDEDTSTDAYKNNFQDITFKKRCGPKDVAHADIDLGISGCYGPENLCSNIYGCIGYRRFGNGCSRLISNTDAPSYEYTADEDGKDRNANDISSKEGFGVDLDECKRGCDFLDNCVGISYNPTIPRCAWKHAGVLEEDLIDNEYTFYRKGSEISTGS